MLGPLRGEGIKDTLRAQAGCDADGRYRWYAAVLAAASAMHAVTAARSLDPARHLPCQVRSRKCRRISPRITGVV